MKYPFFLQRTSNNYTATPVQFPGLATSEDRDVLERLMAEQLALHLHECQQCGEQPPAPLGQHEIDFSDFEGEEAEVVYVEPAPLSEISLQLARALERSGLTQAEVARRMGTSRSAVNRLIDPFYFGHSISTMQRFAEALGTQLVIDFATRKAEQAIASKGR
jgi:predicted XRE-type DNA-binding protein